MLFLYKKKTAYESSGEAGGSKEVSSQLVVPGEDAPEVLEASEGILDEMPFLVGLSVEGEGLLAVGSVGHDGAGAALL